MTLFQHHLLALGVTSATTFGLSLFVLWKNPKRNLNRSVALYCLSLAWWSGWECAALQMPTKELAYQLIRTQYIGVVFIPTLLCTAVSFLLEFSPRTRRRFLLPLYVFSAGALFPSTIHPTDQFLVASLGPVAYLPMYGKAGSYYWIFLVFFIGAASVGHAMVFRKWQRAEGQERTRLGLFLVGSLVAYLGGCPEFALKYGVRLGWLNPFGLYGVPFYIGMVTYAIVQHHFLDIRVAIRKSLVYSLLIACITATYLVTVLVTERWFQGFLGYHSIPATVFVAFLIAIFFNPLRNRIQAFVDRALFNVTPLELLLQREQWLREVQKTDQLKAVATLAAGMAHEIKNPLSAIKTFTEYLPQKYDEPAFREKFVRIVSQEVGKINTLVQRLLDFAKPTQPNKQPAHLSHLMDETVEFLQGTLLSKRIEVVRAYSQQDEMPVDRAKMKQVFLNVLLNSIEAMDGHGGRITLTSVSDDGHLDVMIADTGPGIPQGDLPRVFEPFYTTKPSGTGLGLSVVHRIIHEHGGRVSLDSTLGRGTTVRIRLPALTVR